MITSLTHLQEYQEPYETASSAKDTVEKMIKEALDIPDKAAGRKGFSVRRRVIRGMAANQCVFNSKRCFIFRERGFLKLEPLYTVCVNPKIIKQLGKRKTTEGCLSFPGRDYDCFRPRYVKLEFYDLNGNKHIKWYGPKNAHVIAHEMDHLNGITLQQRSESKSAKEIIERM